MNNRERIIEHYNNLDRSYFMSECKDHADMDMPFSIGYGQTISQPSLVLKMTLLLDIEEDSKVLELGTGSGYQTAILSNVGKEVYTVERIKELYLEAEKRLKKAGYSNIRYKLDDGNIGWEENGPYDRIMVTAAASRLPEDLVKQLANEGKMIIPVGAGGIQDLLLVEKDKSGVVSKEIITQVRFVPLIGDY